MKIAVLVVLALAGAVSVAQAGRQVGEPLALLRAQQPDDVVPAQFSFRGANITESRLVASVRVKGVPVKLYLLRTAGGNLCTLLVNGGRGTGMGCRPPATFFGLHGAIAAVSGRIFAGVAANDVAQVVIIDRYNGRHPMALTADHGFIASCSGPDGCACQVAWVEAYNAAGEMISRDRWLAPRCWKLGL